MKRDVVVAMLSFEGPDIYSQAGGLGVRARELTRELAGQGYTTHLYFVGDPALAADETAVDGRLHLHRRCQALSSRFPGGVYEAEEEKIRDWNLSVPEEVIDGVIAPAVATGAKVVLLAEEWQTSWSVNLLAVRLAALGLRDQVVILWNANNVFGFDRVEWKALGAAATLTTVSRYMKHRMWAWDVDAIVIPNGIPAAGIVDPPPADRAAVRKAAGGDVFCFKIGRFDPDKRWLMAIAGLGLLKRQGLKVRLLMRGGSEAHGRDVLAHAAGEGLAVVDEPSPADAAGLAAALRRQRTAEVVNLVTFMPESLQGTVYAAADAVLANSGHEPFGLVGLEVMAAGGVAVTGSTGEDYAVPFGNAIVIDTADPLELATALRLLHDRPALAARLRSQGRATAAEFTWEKVAEQLWYRVELAALKQGVALPPKSR